MLDAMFKRHVLIYTIETKFFGLKFLKAMYLYDFEYSKTFIACTQFSTNGFFRHNSYLSKRKKLCMPKCSTRDLSLRETRKG